MITVACEVCGEDFTIDIDEFLEDTEHYCPACAAAAHDFICDNEPNMN